MRLLTAWSRKLDRQSCARNRSFLRFLSTDSTRIDFQANDAKWQAIWQAAPLIEASAKRKKYVLPMFAYPSGSLHMGHLRVYTISDVLARYNRMKGYDVLHPTGWDAFGLPAENAAIERGVDPEAWTLANIEKMKGQLKSMNTHFDWDRKLFLMLYKKGFAYQAEALVNYDPVDKTVLANEQVDKDGRSWRSGAIVEQRMLKQWFFRITAFQQALLDDLDTLAEDNRWPDRVIQQQRHWIGRSKGARLQFQLELQDSTKVPVNVFTTRPDTLFGVRYLALSMSHPVVQELAKTNPALSEFLARKASFGPDSKDGFELSVQATSPVSILHSGAPSDITVFTAPYVLDGYGEGAVMGVPAHDTRDFSFWKKHKPNESIPVVVGPDSNDSHALESTLEEAYTEHGQLTPLCGPYAGMQSRLAGEKIVNDLLEHGAEPTETWRLRDWLISRQRYWGTPIPIIHCDSCGVVPVPDEHLPVELPKLGEQIQGQKGNPLDSIASFIHADCPSCGKPAKRETDTMDTFVDSSWYYARFPDAQNGVELFSQAAARQMLPVDMYVGGVEHAILHLLYARFIFKFLCQEGLIPNSPEVQNREPFSRLIAQGMVHGKTFSDPDTGRFLKPEDVLPPQTEGRPPTVKSTGKEANITWEKMSKSKHNGVDPISCFQKYGADVTRAHMLFAAPLSEVLQWDEEKIVGVQRWLARLSRLVDDLIKTQPDEAPANLDIPSLSNPIADLLLTTNATLRSITHTIENNVYNINTVISDLIKLTNAIHSLKIASIPPAIASTILQTLLKMVAPIAPAFAEQCFEDLGLSRPKGQVTQRTSIFDESWPETILSAAQEEALRARQTKITCAVQVNGKFRFAAKVPAPVVEGGKVVESEEQRGAVISAVLNCEMGRVWLREKNDWERRRDVFVVQGGKVVNVVF